MKSIYVELYMFLMMLGCGIGICIFQKPMSITFKLSLTDGFLVAMPIYVYITLFMFFKMIFNQYQLDIIENNESVILNIISKLLDSGVLIVAFIGVLSHIFGKKIKKYNLDLSKAYDENIVKNYFSVIVILNCIWLVLNIGFKDGFGTKMQINIIGRIFTWVLCVIGTYFGLGFHCEGRVKEQLNSNKK